MGRIYLTLSIIAFTLIGCSKDSINLDPIPEPICVGEAVDTDYSRPSVFNTSHLFHTGYPLEQPWGWPLDIAVVDYNRDGILDAVTSNSDYTYSFNNPDQYRRDILFLKGDCDGNLTLDSEYNSQGWKGSVHARKSIIGDFNSDSFPDIVFIGHGTDNSNALVHGEYPIILMSTQSGYEYKTYPTVQGFWHGGASGDLDNDGDLDILLPPSTLMLNTGGDFTETSLPYEVTDQAGALEIIDLDGDGVLEIVYGSSDFSDHNDSWIGNANNKIATIPVPENYGIVVDLDFVDINQDGTYEIIVNRVGDPEGSVGNYRGWYLQILEYTNDGITDITNSVIEQNSNPNSEWIEWFNISDFDNNGTLDLYSNTDYVDLHWELLNGFLYRRK